MRRASRPKIAGKQDMKQGMTKFTRRAALAGIGAAALTGPANAQPIAGGRPVRLIVPYPAGGAIDLVGRLYAERMEPALGQQVVIDNRSGAAGIVGADAVAKARPDGTTLGVIGMTTLCAYKTLYTRLPFDPDRDLIPVSQVSAGTVVCAVNKDAAAKNGWTDFRALITWMRANPEQARWGTAGVGTTNHLTMAAIEKLTGAKALHVVYRGGAPAVADLQAGVIDLMFELAPALVPLINQGALTPLAVGSAQPIPILPNVPGMASFADLGLGNWEIGAWEAIMAPRGTPPEVIAALYAAVRLAGADPALNTRMRSVGFEAQTSESPDAMGAKIRDEIPFWRKLVEDAGAKLD